MVRPLGRPLARRAVTLDDLREEFLAHLRGPQPEPPGPGVVRGPHPAVYRLVRGPRNHRSLPTFGGRIFRPSSWIAGGGASPTTLCTATPGW